MRFEIGGPMPNITVGRLDGRPFAYEDIWQKQIGRASCRERV